MAVNIDTHEKRWFIGRTDIGNYMHRWVLRTPWFQLRLHHILRSDKGRDPHDHPFDFRSFLLSGPYTEHTPQGVKVWPRFSFIKKKAEDLHFLELHDGPVWTLVFATRERRVWGFQTPDRWVPWHEYFRLFPGEADE